MTPAQKERAVINDAKHMYTTKTCALKRGIPEREVEEIAARLGLDMKPTPRSKK
jgi:hypothetical protein